MCAFPRWSGISSFLGNSEIKIGVDGNAAVVDTQISAVEFPIHDCCVN